MRGRASGLVAFAAGLAILVVALKVLNWLPLAAQKDLMRRYADIEEVRTDLGFRQVLIPAYFPQDLRWPPTVILAQGKPYQAVVMEFERSADGKSKEIVMVISQAASDGFSPGGRLEISRVKERAKYPLRGREAVLEVGSGAQGEQCSRISWREKEFRVAVLARSNPFDVIKVAESMFR